MRSWNSSLQRTGSTKLLSSQVSFADFPTQSRDVPELDVMIFFFADPAKTYSTIRHKADTPLKRSRLPQGWLADLSYQST